MSTLLFTLKVVSLFQVIFWSLINGTKFYRGHRISGMNFFFQSIGITGFIVLQWLI